MSAFSGVVNVDVLSDSRYGPDAGPRFRCSVRGLKRINTRPNWREHKAVERAQLYWPAAHL